MGAVMWSRETATQLISENEVKPCKSITIIKSGLLLWGIRMLPWLKSIASSPGSDTANLEDNPITIKEIVQ
jgi:hypothetical protein